MAAINTDVIPGNEDQFALRGGEVVRVEHPLGKRHRIAVMAHPVERPEGPKVNTCNMIPNVGLPVEDAVVVFARRTPGGEAWSWLSVAPHSKELIGSMVFDNDFPRGEWLGLVVNPGYSLEDCQSVHHGGDE